MIAYFDGAGQLIAIGDDGMGPLPGTEYSAEVPDGTNPNSIYFDAGAVMDRKPFPITVTHGQIAGIPAGTIARVSGSAQTTIASGVLAFAAEEMGNRWVRLEHPHYLDWAGNVPVGPQP